MGMSSIKECTGNVPNLYRTRSVQQFRRGKVKEKEKRKRWSFYRFVYWLQFIFSDSFISYESSFQIRLFLTNFLFRFVYLYAAIFWPAALIFPTWIVFWVTIGRRIYKRMSIGSVELQEPEKLEPHSLCCLMMRLNENRKNFRYWSFFYSFRIKFHFRSFLSLFELNFLFELIFNWIFFFVQMPEFQNWLVKVNHWERLNPVQVPMDSVADLKPKYKTALKTLQEKLQLIEKKSKTFKKLNK